MRKQTGKDDCRFASDGARTLSRKQPNYPFRRSPLLHPFHPSISPVYRLSIVGRGFCMEKGKCWIDDDHRRVTDKLLSASGIILASPVYFFSVSGQMKTFLDRSLAFGHKPRSTWKPGLAVSVSAGLGETDVAAIQVILSVRWLVHATCLERAFLAFLAAGAAWLFFTPPPLASLFVEHSTTLLHLTLFSITLPPQLFGYDPFTYAIAKQWTPEAVWKTAQFRTINLHITCFWSGVFFLAALSCRLGHGKPFYSILLPLVLVLGVGLPFSKIYPGYFLKKQFPSPSTASSFSPQTARELISGMPGVFDPPPMHLSLQTIYNPFTFL